MENELYHHGILGMHWGVRKSSSSKSSSGGKRKSKFSDDSIEFKRLRKKKISQMSNQDLQTVNKRLNLEKNYKDLTKHKSVGKAAVDTFVKTAGTIAAVTAAYGTYKKLGGHIMNKIGGMKV